MAKGLTVRLHDHGHRHADSVPVLGCLAACVLSRMMARGQRSSSKPDPSPRSPASCGDAVEIQRAFLGRDEPARGRNPTDELNHPLGGSLGTLDERSQQVIDVALQGLGLVTAREPALEVLLGLLPAPSRGTAPKRGSTTCPTAGHSRTSLS